MFDITKLTKEEQEKRNLLYDEYSKIRTRAIIEYKEYVTPFQLAYQEADRVGWNKVIQQEYSCRNSVIEFDNYLEGKYKMDVPKRK